MKKILILFCILFLTEVSFSEDVPNVEVKLKSGRVIEGIIVEKTDEYVKVDTGKNVMKIRFSMMDKAAAEIFKKVSDKQESGTETKEKKHGVAETFFGDGQVEAMVGFRDGKEDRTARQFYRDGNPKYTRNYKNGVKDGINNEYYPGGSIKVSEFCNADKNTCSRTEYSKNGRVICEGLIRKDLFDGKVKYFYENGKIKKQSNYREGKLHGTSKKFFADGTLMESARYTDGLLDGEMKRFSKEGKLVLKGRYSEGKIIGYLKSFYEEDFIKSNKSLSSVPYAPHNPFLDGEDHSSCVKYNNYERVELYKNLVIKSSEEYIRLFSDISNAYNKYGCREIKLSKVNFSKEILLGYYAEGPCSDNIQKYVIRDSEAKTVTYNIEFVEDAVCGERENGRDFNLIRITKIPEDFEVKFKVDILLSKRQKAMKK